MVSQSWFRNFFPTLKKSESRTSEERIAVLAFEASGLMTKLVQLWQSLTDKQVSRLREEITNSVGIKKLVSEEDDYIARLMCAEMMENLVHVAKVVSRLSKKCNSPLLKSFELAFSDLIKIGADPSGWLLTWKMMDKKVQKMEQFIVMNSNLYQEMEVLADLEQTYMRMKSSDTIDTIGLVEYEKKLTWKQQLVRHLKEKSLWNQTYDYTVLLLARSVFTTYCRIGHVFGIDHISVMANSTVSGVNASRHSSSTIFTQSSVYPFENSANKDSSFLSGNSVSMSGPLSGNNYGVSFLSGPLRNAVPTSNPAPDKSGGFSFYSGPLKKWSTKPGPVSKAGKSPFRLWQFRDRSQEQSSSDGPTMHGEHVSPMTSGYSISTNHQLSQVTDDATSMPRIHGAASHRDSFLAASKSKILNPPPESLGAAALALHYANLVVLIEKLVASPHLVGHDARNDLYNMLPARIRIALRSRLKPYAKNVTASVCDTALAGEWNEAMQRILEWLAPLAHNMIKWQSERSYEHQNSGFRTNVLLVQTLYFANQEKTEAVITELLIGLNYVWRFGREVAAKSLAGYASRTTAEGYLED